MTDDLVWMAPFMADASAQQTDDDEVEVLARWRALNDLDAPDLDVRRRQRSLRQLAFTT